MEEILTLHNLNLEWGCITNLMDKIANIEEAIDGGWSELVDMVADAVTEEGERKDPESAFFNLYQFLWRLYFRLKTNSEKRKFNIVQYHDDEFIIKNYDYSTFKWAKDLGCGKYTTNDYIKIPFSKLTEKQRYTLKRRVEK